MGENTGISWTKHTFNPWWGCHKVSAECANCYAETTAERFHPGHWGLKSPRWFFEDKHWNDPIRWNAKAEKEGVRHRVFCASMADVFELHPVEEIQEAQNQARERLWKLIRKTPNLDWLLLTKRPENFELMLPWMSKPCMWCKPPGSGQDSCEVNMVCSSCSEGMIDAEEPWSNVWLGVTAGVKESLSRVLTLRNTPAAVRFISCEPLLENITAEYWDAALGSGESCEFCNEMVRYWNSDGEGYAACGCCFEGPEPCERLTDMVDWLIVGDESGPGRRAGNIEWVRTARDAAIRHNVAFHFKQWAGDLQPGVSGLRTAGRDGKIHLPLLDGKQHADFPDQQN